MRRELEDIYAKHRQGLYTLALSITRCAAGAEDAVQDAFARLWRSGRARAGKDPAPYVFAAVRNAALDQLRRRRRRAGAADDESIFNGRSSDPAAAAMTAEQEELLREALESLPDEQREAVVLRIYAGLTFEGVARAMGCPLPTAVSRYRRALEKLHDRCRRCR